MINATIFVDNKPYLGEDYGKTYKNSSFGGNGWLSNHHGEIPVLKFGEKNKKANKIIGMVGIRGTLERILVRMDKGLIKTKDIKIKIKNIKTAKRKWEN